MKEKIKWLDGIKGIACCSVFLVHFFDIFVLRGCTTADGNVWGILAKTLQFMLYGQFWVYIFCIISGYLAAGKKIETLKSLVVESFFRYLRFVIPLAFVTVFAFILKFAAGYRTQNYVRGWDSSWIAAFYKENMSIKDLIKCVFFFSSANVDSPLWVLRPMLLGNIACFVLNYVFQNTPILRKWMYVAAVLLCVAAGHFYPLAYYAGAVLLGGILPLVCEEAEEAKTKKRGIVWGIILLVVLCMLGGVQNLIVSRIPGLPGWFTLKDSWTKSYFLFAYAVLTLMAVSRIGFVKKALSCGFMQAQAKISFPVFMLHFPLMCSVGLLLYGLLGGLQADLKLLLLFVILLAMVIAAAVLYNLIWGRWTSRLLAKVKGKIKA